MKELFVCEGMTLNTNSLTKENNNSKNKIFCNTKCKNPLYCTFNVMTVYSCTANCGTFLQF